MKILLNEQVKSVFITFLTITGYFRSINQQSQVIKYLIEVFKREMFNPGLIGLFFNPFFIIRRGLYKGIKKHSGDLQGRLLDFGCGRKPYRDLFKVDEYIGVDVEVSGHDKTLMQVDVYYDGKTLPFPDQHFDSVFTSEVFEHVFELDEVLREINRVCKPGAKLLITVPFVWEEHETPYDYGRYTSFGLAHVLEKHGFKIIELTKSTTTVETLFQLWNHYVHGQILRKRPIQVLLTPLLIAPVNIIGLLVSLILPTSRNLFHNNIVFAAKSTNS